ncbi:CocE/NonD family hydrolase [Variovorax boronicumulans]|uniref:CocE/NonD family hydrolase n=1 Tax=Variovorax boronicumulans TaxID=436515 RepID=UPI00214B67DD
MKTLKPLKRWQFAASLAAMSTLAVGLAACGGGSSGNAPAPTTTVPPVATGPDTPSVKPPTTEPENPVVTPPETEPVRKWGYITLPNGDKMRYSLLLPPGPGPFPVLVEYDGYLAGSTPGLSQRWVAEGYAAMGINVPGTGCSTGDDHVFDASTGAAGAFAVEWAGKQPWSNGRIGMIGASYSGYNQLWVAAQRPKGLLAITPAKNVADPYRDVGYPGGIKNIGFPAAWWGSFPPIWNEAASVAAQLDGDTACAQTVADNIEKIKRPELDLTKWLENPYADGLFVQRSAYLETSKIDIPVLTNVSWQDEQVGPRAGYYEDTIARDKMWFLGSNGNHGTNITDDTYKRFLDHFVKGQDNGFEKEPHVRLLQEVQDTGAPNAVATFDRLPVPVKPMRLWMQANGGLGDIAPVNASPPSTYRYPVDSPAVNNPADEGWKSVTAADGQLTFTTPKLPEDLSFYGEGSADVWLSATAADTDLQVTVSEVRPDGKEMFVQRGWLRASKRALDPTRTTELRPWQIFTADALRPLTANVPVLARVEIQRFAHVFRAGSALRVTIDSPSQTGFWVFGHNPTPSTNSIWHNSEFPSSIVLGHLRYPHAAALPSCDKTLRQPCRDSVTVVPLGIGPRPPA